ncbi:hypothetical protein FNF29_04523 [Cafeteria roenbergensis]|uniref:Uncharacterized protein n=1 Tax=Cafeteria roenbergensis TaxID=33653 RepID=A0A5A8CG03_CAFRO|nr:hypothetical protein FNF29_04523 [Cafeteria roenbergensis]|eukprot:KAA0151599.1 hypothetical protein FNF29_04523 [Cafeteria roenbergensis]
MPGVAGEDGRGGRLPGGLWRGLARGEEGRNPLWTCAPAPGRVAMAALDAATVDPCEASGSARSADCPQQRQERSDCRFPDAPVSALRLPTADSVRTGATLSRTTASKDSTEGDEDETSSSIAHQNGCSVPSSVTRSFSVAGEDAQVRDNTPRPAATRLNQGVQPPTAEEAAELTARLRAAQSDVVRLEETVAALKHALDAVSATRSEDPAPDQALPAQPLAGKQRAPKRLRAPVSATGSSSSSASSSSNGAFSQSSASPADSTPTLEATGDPAIPPAKRLSVDAWRRVLRVYRGVKVGPAVPRAQTWRRWSEAAQSVLVRFAVDGVDASLVLAVWEVLSVAGGCIADACAMLADGQSSSSSSSSSSSANSCPGEPPATGTPRTDAKDEGSAASTASGSPRHGGGAGTAGPASADDEAGASSETADPPSPHQARATSAAGRRSRRATPLTRGASSAAAGAAVAAEPLGWLGGSKCVKGKLQAWERQLTVLFAQGVVGGRISVCRGELARDLRAAVNPSRTKEFFEKLVSRRGFNQRLQDFLAPRRIRGMSALGDVRLRGLRPH